jgi:DegV family protein with EDD domain
MLIVTNRGSNLPGALVRHYGIKLTPQLIIVDGAAHDTSDTAALSQVDDWIRTARLHPHIVGTTAQEYVSFLTRGLREDPEVIAVMTSKRLIQSYLACTTAARTIAANPSFRDARIAVVDSRSTDVGAGLVTILAGEAARAHVPFERTVELLEAASAQCELVATVDTLDYLVKGGRATWAKAQLANFLKVRPLLACVDGEVANVGKISTSADAPVALADLLAGRIGRGRPVFLGVAHGDAPRKADALLEALRTRLDVKYAYSRQLTMTTYLQLARGGLAAAAVPLDRLPWWPPIPPA